MTETFTKFPNWLYDHIDSLSSDEWKIISMIVRETSGYHRREASIEYKRMEGVVANRSRLSAMLESLAGRGFISRRKDGRNYVYSMGSGPVDMLPDVTDTPPEVLPDVTNEPADMLPDVTDICYATSHIDAEYVTSGNTLLYSKEKEDKERRKKATPIPIAILREHFARQTITYPNDKTGTFDRDWQQPLQAILDKLNGDTAAAIIVIDEALGVARGQNERGKIYTVSCPRSIAGIAANLIATRTAASSTAEDDTLWQRAIQAITRREYSDERLKAAIRAIGGSDRIAKATAKDADQLKRNLGYEYRRISAAV